MDFPHLRFDDKIRIGNIHLLALVSCIACFVPGVRLDLSINLAKLGKGQ